MPDGRPRPPAATLGHLSETKAELLSLQQLRCFCATVRAGSFTAAADLLGLTQPAVAEHVRNLERALGVALFARVGRGLVPTAAGNRFAERAPLVLAALVDAVAGVDDLAALRSGTLAFGFFSTPEAYDIDQLVSRFARRHPGLAIRLVGVNSASSADGVRRGDLEAALVALPVDERGLDVQALVRDEVLYVTADPARAAAPVSVADLAARTLVLYEAELGARDPLRRLVAERARTAGVRVAPRIDTATMVMALRLVADGVGDTIVPRALARAEYFPAGLHVAPLDPPMHQTLALVRRSGAKLSHAVSAFVRDLQAHLAEVVAGLEPDEPDDPAG